MELMNFRKQYLENVKLSAAVDAVGTSESFVKNALDDLLDYNIINDFNECFSCGKYGRKSYRIDAYYFDDFDNSLSIFIADYNGEDLIETLTLTEAKVIFEKGYTFLAGCLNGNLYENFEISTPVYDLCERLNSNKNDLRRFRIFIITDKVMSEKILSFDENSINNIPVEYNLWDIERLFRITKSTECIESLRINFLDFTDNGLPCLRASDVCSDDIQCLLCVIPGRVLADLYDNYGSKLLEGNVRSFLSAKGKVNKNIRKTILESDGESKKMFFAYNNGISATATEVNIKTTESGNFITAITNLQIVNGGQTTASLSNTRYKDKADLTGVFVQMKLSVIRDHKQAQILIPKISRGSNSQNKVSDADFFSNHEFNVRMQKLSRVIFAPAINGLQYETRWFYERSRGQFEQEQTKMTASEKKKFQMINPKSQKITKTDIAKYQNAWSEYPYFVSMGAQKNFNKFANFIVDSWDKDNSQFNEQYYKKSVVLCIIYECINKIIPKQDWYEQGYKANIIVYTMSFLHHLINVQYPNYELDFSVIWEKQNVHNVLYEQFIDLSKFVYLHITDSSRRISNVTEWCKTEDCWKSLKAKSFELNPSIQDVLISKVEYKKEILNGKKEQRAVSRIQTQMHVVEKGPEYWKDVLAWARVNSLLDEAEISFLLVACQMDRRLPTEKQCQRIVEIEDKLIDEGFINKRK